MNTNTNTNNMRIDRRRKENAKRFPKEITTEVDKKERRISGNKRTNQKRTRTKTEERKTAEGQTGRTETVSAEHRDQEREQIIASVQRIVIIGIHGWSLFGGVLGT